MSFYSPASPPHPTPLLLRGFRIDLRCLQGTGRNTLGLRHHERADAMPSTPSRKWILQGWDGSYQPRWPTHWHPPDPMGSLRALSNSPLLLELWALGSVPGWRMPMPPGPSFWSSARSLERCQWSGSGSSTWSGAELRKFIPEVALGLPHTKHPSQKHGAATF